jgi:NADH:ubiquinone oxidoreductase subunit 3 (subunit A)
MQPTNAALSHSAKRTCNSNRTTTFIVSFFLIFDVEAIFLVPFAVAFTGLPMGAFIAVLVFLLLLIEGLVWAWAKGCLRWQQ